MKKTMLPIASTLYTAAAFGQQRAVKYQVGGRGPCGGWVFYDKGVFSNGWRYLEAAPVEKEFEAPFGKAVQICAALDFGGKQDWFLPSRDELDLMYQNLKQKGIGDFRDVRYWSSSHSQYDDRYACYQDFSNGSQYGEYDDKLDTHWVRAVRAF